MLSENLKELSAILASFPGESPRVYGNGDRLFPGERRYLDNLDDEAADFPGTEKLFLSEISSSQRLPSPPDQ